MCECCIGTTEEETDEQTTVEVELVDDEEPIEAD